MNGAMISRKLLQRHIFKATNNIVTFNSRSFSMILKNTTMNRATNLKHFYLNQSKFSFSSKTQSYTSGQPGDSYISSRYSNIVPESDLTPYAEVDSGEIEQYISEILMQKYGFTEEEIDYTIHFNNNIALPSKYPNGAVLESTLDYFISDFGCTIDEAKEILLRYPKYMNVEREELDKRIEKYIEIGISKQVLTRDEVSEIFRANPFYLLCPQQNYKMIISTFYNYRFSKEETVTMLKEAGGILGMKKTSIKGLFDVGKQNTLLTHFYS